MRTVLIITGRYLPGYRDGGPVRSLINLTDTFGDEYDIRIMCLDRDHGDTKRYPGITLHEYNDVGKAKVWYTERFTEQAVMTLAADADVVYVCGPYSDYARTAMRLKKSGKIRALLYIAPMGSFSAGAYNIKGIKKRLYIKYMKLAGMFDNVTWSVTSAREEEELKAAVGTGSRCVIAADLPRSGTTQHTRVKRPYELKLIFISRISRKKNLSAIPEILEMSTSEHRIWLDIYGTEEDTEYLHECMKMLDDVQKSHPYFDWEYKGEADSGLVPDILAGYDAFLFPTLGENYGHVIAESLSSGCIPVISDTTPWTDLDERGCGYVCPCEDPSAFAEAIDELVSMSEEDIQIMRRSCYEYIEEVNRDSVKNSGYRKIFESGGYENGRDNERL